MIAQPRNRGSKKFIRPTFRFPSAGKKFEKVKKYVVFLLKSGIELAHRALVIVLSPSFFERIGKSIGADVSGVRMKYSTLEKLEKLLKGVRNGSQKEVKEVQKEKGLNKKNL
ncbi:MAG TPA: hypothetical protein VNN78_04185 [Burkholderiales bacterium]|nr:hypothetical protein [Burkholderiales bacterium]